MMGTLTGPSSERRGNGDETGHQANSSFLTYNYDTCIHHEWIRNDRIPNRGISHFGTVDKDFILQNP